MEACDLYGMSKAIGLASIRLFQKSITSYGFVHENPGFEHHPIPNHELIFPFEKPSGRYALFLCTIVLYILGPQPKYATSFPARLPAQNTYGYDTRQLRL